MEPSTFATLLISQIEINQDYIASRIVTKQMDSVTEHMLAINTGRIHALELVGEYSESVRLSARGLRVTFEARESVRQADRMAALAKYQAVPNTGEAKQ